ncbi:MAG: hypothetical protein KC493_14565 [Bacteriovoracaceae bacterium]|nr:hypothetical protein [Bacteriovoracaceae bacterium]
MKKLILATLVLLTATQTFARDKCYRSAKRWAVSEVKKEMKREGHGVSYFDITHKSTRLKRRVRTGYGHHNTYVSKVRVFDRVEIAAEYVVVFTVRDGYPFCSLEGVRSVYSDME